MIQQEMVKKLIAIRMSIEASGTLVTAEETVLMAVDKHVSRSHLWGRGHSAYAGITDDSV